MYCTCVCLKIRHPEVFAIPQEKLTKHSGTEKNLEEYLQEMSNLWRKS